jgi:serine/threonine-protein phosphatase 2B regulatory subunit
MGNKAGTLPKKEVKRFKAMGIQFSTEEMNLLHNHFKDLATETEGVFAMNRNNFKRSLGFKQNQYIDRMFMLFDEDGDGHIQFSEFLHGLNILSERGSVDEKIEFSFMIYDFDGDGKISREELARMLVASLEESGLHLEQDTAQSCVDFTIKNIQPPVKDPQFVMKDEYIAMVKAQQAKGHNMMRALSVNVSQRIKVMSRTAPSAAAPGEK